MYGYVMFCSRICARARSWREFAKCRFTRFPSFFTVHVDTYGLLSTILGLYKQNILLLRSVQNPTERLPPGGHHCSCLSNESRASIRRVTPHVMISTYNCTINYASNVRFVLITVLQC